MGPFGRTAVPGDPAVRGPQVAAGGPPVGELDARPPQPRGPGASWSTRSTSLVPPCVLVDMPVTHEFVDAHGNGQADYDTYLTMLRDLGPAHRHAGAVLLRRRCGTTGSSPTSST